MYQIMSAAYSPVYHTGPHGIGMTVDLRGTLVLIFLASINNRKKKRSLFFPPTLTLHTDVWAAIVVDGSL